MLQPENLLKQDSLYQIARFFLSLYQFQILHQLHLLCVDDRVVVGLICEVLQLLHAPR